MAMSSKRFGCVVVVDAEEASPGSSRTATCAARSARICRRGSVDQVMTRNPKWIEPDVLAATALQRIQSSSITGLIVVEDNKVEVGFVHLHDLLKIGVARRYQSLLKLNGLWDDIFRW